MTFNLDKITNNSVIVIAGNSCSGKTTMANLVANSFNREICLVNGRNAEYNNVTEHMNFEEMDVIFEQHKDDGYYFKRKIFVVENYIANNNNMSIISKYVYMNKVLGISIVIVSQYPYTIFNRFSNKIDYVFIFKMANFYHKMFEEYFTNRHDYIEHNNSLRKFEALVLFHGKNKMTYKSNH